MRAYDNKFSFSVVQIHFNGTYTMSKYTFGTCVLDTQSVCTNYTVIAQPNDSHSKIVQKCEAEKCHQPKFYKNKLRQAPFPFSFTLSRSLFHPVFVFQIVISAMIQSAMKKKTNQQQYRRALIHFTYHILESRKKKQWQ